VAVLQDAYGAPTANIYVSHDDLKTAEQLDFHQAANGHVRTRTLSHSHSHSHSHSLMNTLAD